jgi:hypothetical protein
MTNELFYAQLPLLHDFQEATDPVNYHSIPDGWIIVSTDIQGSTKAIEEGRYREVNVLGASSLMAILNVVKGTDVPYVFGGDGALVVVPNSYKDAVAKVLRATKRLARDHYALELRTGIIPIETIREAGADIRVAKHAVGPTATIAMFRGGGCAMADKILKASDRKSSFLIEDDALEIDACDIEGLQCRWDPIKASRGSMMTLLLSARGGSDQSTAAVYRSCLKQIEEIVALECPVKRSVLEEQLYRTWFRRGRSELFAFSYKTSVLKRLGKAVRILFEMAAFRYMLRNGKKGAEFDPEKYISEVPRATDYRKFDDTLRMVFECTSEQQRELEQFLEREFAAGNIFYGLHTSAAALMTCMVFNYNQHLHLIDGSDGGYAVAAKQYKSQLKMAS